MTVYLFGDTSKIGMTAAHRMTVALAMSCVVSCVLWCARLHDSEPEQEDRWVAVVLYCQLGNQLFQMASSHGIAKQRAARWCMEDADHRDYVRGLEWLVQPPERSPGLVVGIPKIISTWYLASFTILDSGAYATFSDLYAKSPLPRILPWNCLQSFKYFDRKVPIPFRLKATPLAKAWVKARQITTAIHVRRGDKLTDIGNVVPPLHYFRQALLLLSAMFPIEHRYVITTDDPEWVRAQPLFMKMHVLHSEDMHFDMAVISQCQHKILSIGTFGWWGAFLTDTGSNQSNAVIYAMPQMEGRLEAGMNYADYFPQHWTPIDYRSGRTVAPLSE